MWFLPKRYQSMAAYSSGIDTCDVHAVIGLSMNVTWWSQTRQSHGHSLKIHLSGIAHQILQMSSGRLFCVICVEKPCLNCWLICDPLLKGNEILIDSCSPNRTLCYSCSFYTCYMFCILPYSLIPMWLVYLKHEESLVLHQQSLV